MKNASHILSSLRHRPQFKKLARFACIRRIQTLFPPHLQRLVRYGYIHNKTVYYVLSHPGAKQEFDNIIDSIKMPLKLHLPKECSETAFDDIRAYVTHKRPAPPVVRRPTSYRFKERSKASFKNDISDHRLYTIIEKTRHIIHARND